MRRAKDPQICVSMPSLFCPSLKYSLVILCQSRADHTAVLEVKRGAKSAHFVQLFLKGQGLFNADLPGTCTPKSWLLQIGFSLQPFFGWPIFAHSRRNWAGAQESEFGPVLLCPFAPCRWLSCQPGLSPEPCLVAVKLNVAFQLLNGFLSDKVKSCQSVQTHMTPPHFQQEEITLRSVS